MYIILFIKSCTRNIAKIVIESNPDHCYWLLKVSIRFMTNLYLYLVILLIYFMSVRISI